MSKESDAVKAANDQLQAGTGAAADTKNYANATTQWITTNDPVTPPPPPPPPVDPPTSDWRNNVGFATGDIYQNPGQYAQVGIPAGTPQSRFPSLIKEAGGRLIRTSWYGTPHDDELNLAMSFNLKCVVTFQPIEGIGDAAVIGMVTRFRNRISFYELGNEPNLHNYGPGPYAARVAHFAPLIKQADPNTKVITGGLWLGGAGNPDAYCKALIDAHAFDRVDMFTLHYPEDGGMWPYVGRCRSMLDAAGLQRVGIAATECCPKNASESGQASACQKNLDWVKNGTLQLATCFSILPDYDRPYQFVNGNMTKRQAFYTFQKAVA